MTTHIYRYTVRLLTLPREYTHKSIHLHKHKGMTASFTYELGLLLCQGLAQVSLLLLQSVARGQRGSSVGHGWLPILLLQVVSYDQEGPESNVHPLRAQTQTQRERESGI